MWDLGYGGIEWGLDEGYAVGDDEGDRPTNSSKSKSEPTTDHLMLEPTSGCWNRRPISPVHSIVFLGRLHNMQSDNYLIPDVHISYVDATEHRQLRISTRPVLPPNQVRLSVTATTTITVTVTFTVAVDVTGTDTGTGIRIQIGFGIGFGIGITLSGVNGRAVSRRMDTYSPAISEPHPHPNEYEHDTNTHGHDGHEHRFITSSEAPSGHTENVHVHTHTHTLIHTPVSDPHSRVPSVQYTTGRVGVDA